MTTPGVLASTTDPRFGRCALDVRGAVASTEADLFDGGTFALSIRPRISGTGIIASDDEVFSAEPVVLRSCSGRFDFAALSGQTPGLNPSDFAWSATLTQTGRTIGTFIFSPTPGKVTDLVDCVAYADPPAATPVIRGPQGEPGPPGADGATGDAAALAAHIVSPTPHPAYDDIPDLALLFRASAA